MDQENVYSGTVIREDQDLWIAYMVDQRLFAKRLSVKKSFCESLLYGDESRVEDFFERYRKGRPVLECLTYTLFHQLPHHESFLLLVNETLEKCELKSHVITADQIRNLPVPPVDETNFQNRHERDKTFKKIFRTISSRVPDLERFIAHFLLEYHKIQTIRINYSQDVGQRLLQVLNKWYEGNKPEKTTWSYLKTLLIYFHEQNLVDDIDKDLFGLNPISKPARSKNHLKESLETVSERQEQTGVVRTNPGVLTHTAFRDIYEKLDFSEIEMPDKIDIVVSGKLCTTPMRFDDYTTKCRQFFSDYFNIEFHEDMFRDNIRFPPAYMCKSKIYDVAAKFELPNTVLITDYNLVEHCKMLRLDLNDIYDKLHIDASSIGNGERQFLLFDYMKQCIYIVHYSEADSEEGALKDLKSGDNYCRFFSFVFSNVLGKDQSYVNVVAAPHITSDCENDLILNKHHIYEMDLQDKLLDLQDYINLISNKPLDTKHESHQNTILAVSYIFSFLATRKIGPESLFATVTEKILSMWLTQEQFKAVFSEERWRIVTGGYGSGKSVVTRSLLEHLVKHAAEPVDIYFTLFDNDSLFLKSLEKFIKKIRDSYNVSEANVIFGNCKEIESCLSKEFENIFVSPRKDIPFTVSNMLLAMIEKYKSSKRMFHLIIDELDGEVINAVEALAIKDIFEHNDVLKNSHVLFSIRSMEKKRANVINEQRMEHDSFRCYKNCGMKVMPLSLSIRVTKQVSKIIQISKEGITRPTRILQPPMKINKENKVKENTANKTVESSKSNLINHHTTNKTVSQSSTTRSLSTARSKLHMQHNNPDEIDSVAPEHDQKFDGSNTAIETDFIFHQCNSYGHNISGRQPVLVFLNKHEKKDLSATDQSVLLSIALQRHCYKNRERNEKRMIICNEENEYKMCISALAALNRGYLLYRPGASDNQSCDEKSLETTVITNYAGCRGMECSQVVVLINPKEHFKRQFFIEMISRCTDHLVLIVPYPYEENEHGPNERESMDTILEKLCHHNKSNDNLMDIFSYALSGHPENQFPHAVSSYCSQSKITTIKINTKSPQHTRYCQNVMSNELPNITKANKNPALSFMQPDPVNDLHVEILSDKLIELSWVHPENSFQVAKMKLSINKTPTSKEYEIIYPRFHGNKLQLPVEKNLSYKIKIHAISKYGGLLSLPTEIDFSSSNIESHSSTHSTSSTAPPPVSPRLTEKEYTSSSNIGSHSSTHSTSSTAPPPVSPRLPEKEYTSSSNIESHSSTHSTSSTAPLPAPPHQPAKEYTFGDLRKLIYDNKVSALRHLIISNPSIIKMRGTYPNFNITLLMEASYHEKPSMVQMLLDSGAETGEKNSYGCTAIHWCADYNSYICVKLLLAHAPHDVINSRDNLNQTALHVASSRGHIETVKELLNYQIDTRVRNYKGETAYDVACDRRGNDEEKRRIREVILQHEKKHPQ